MMKVIYEGHEIAFGKAHKNEYGEYVIKVYVDGRYDEGKTIYESNKASAEATRDAEIERMKTEIREIEEAKAEMKAYRKEQKYKRRYSDLFYQTKYLTPNNDIYTKNEKGGWGIKTIYIIYRTFKCDRKDKAIRAICSTRDQAEQLIEDFNKDDYPKIFDFTIEENSPILITKDLI